MNAIDPVALTCQLVDIDSTTGHEGGVARVLSALLRARGYRVVEQPVDGDRINVLASVGEPVVTLSTHVDCVPPFFPSRLASGRIYGRGATDAKGIVAAQVAAAERLRAAGETRVGLLFVAAEEGGSSGAKRANTVPTASRFLVNGEPTENRLALATRGVLRLRLVATGRAAHSGYPELGDSAIDKLLDALERLRRTDLPHDALLGRTHFTIGLINGGVAANVVSPYAKADVMFRTVGDVGPLFQIVQTCAEGLVTIQRVVDIPPVRLMTVPGFETDVFAYGTDIPYLTNWGRPLLLGPGSIHVAHTDDEHIEVAQLERAVDLYADLVGQLLRQGP